MKTFFTFVLVFFLSVSVHAQYFFKSSTNTGYAALFLYANKEKAKIYLASPDSPEPLEMTCDGQKELLGKKVLRFSRLGYKSIYIELLQNMKGFNLFDNDLKPVATYVNDSKSAK